MSISTIAPEGMFRVVLKEVVGNGISHVGDFDLKTAVTKTDAHNNARDSHLDDFLVVFDDQGARVHGPKHDEATEN